METPIISEAADAERFTLQGEDGREVPAADRQPIAKHTDEQLLLARIGVAVRVLRIERRLTQGKLARRAGVTESTIVRLEGGTSSAHVITLAAIERGLGTKPGWLIRLAS